MANVKRGVERRSKTQGFQMKPSVLASFRKLSKETKISLGDLLELMIMNAVRDNMQNKNALSTGVNATNDIIFSSPNDNDTRMSHKKQEEIKVGGQNNETKF